LVGKKIILALVKEDIAMSKYSTQQVIHLTDINCVSAIRYETSYQPLEILKDKHGQFVFVFNYSDVLEQLIEDYDNGDFRVTVPGYLESHSCYVDEMISYADDFDSGSLTSKGC